LRQAGLFREVYVTDRISDPNAQLLIRGNIINTDWDGTGYSYLVSGYAVVFYALGLPMGSVHDTLSLKLDLVDNSNGQVLWTHEITQSYEKTEGLYYNYAEDFGYPQMFPRRDHAGDSGVAELHCHSTAGFLEPHADGARRNPSS
jgi:hypothetical protein